MKMLGEKNQEIKYVKKINYNSLKYKQYMFRASKQT